MGRSFDETGAGDYIPFEPDEIAKAVPEADKTLDVQAFVPCDQVDDVYFDRPYYLEAHGHNRSPAISSTRAFRCAITRIRDTHGVRCSGAAVLCSGASSLSR
jgi:hypothetical protein